MACVADPDLAPLSEHLDEPCPDTVPERIPETQPSPSAAESDRPRIDMSMAVWPDPI